MMEVTPMLRHLLDSLAARQISAPEVGRAPVMRMSDKLERRRRQIEQGYAQPKSVCTSLRDICEM